MQVADGLQPARVWRGDGEERGDFNRHVWVHAAQPQLRAVPGADVPTCRFVILWQLGMLIHEQILQHCAKFNLIQFSSTVSSWAGAPCFSAAA